MAFFSLLRLFFHPLLGLFSLQIFFSWYFCYLFFSLFSVSTYIKKGAEISSLMRHNNIECQLTHLNYSPIEESVRHALRVLQLMIICVSSNYRHFHLSYVFPFILHSSSSLYCFFVFSFYLSEPCYQPVTLSLTQNRCLSIPHYLQLSILSPRLPPPSVYLLSLPFTASFLPSILIFFSTYHCLDSQQHHDFQAWICWMVSSVICKQAKTFMNQCCYFSTSGCRNFLYFFLLFHSHPLTLWFTSASFPPERWAHTVQLIIIPLCKYCRGGHPSTSITLHSNSSNIVVFCSSTFWQTSKGLSKLSCVYFTYSKHTSVHLLPCWSSPHFCVYSLPLYSLC